MSSILADLRYAKSHEWVKVEADGTALVGITDYAQDSLGDITYVQAPAPGTALAVGDTFGVVESVKAASDLYAPIAGEVLEANAALDAAPETVNRSPYAEGWIMRIKPVEGAMDHLLDAAAYAAHLG